MGALDSRNPNDVISLVALSQQATGTTPYRTSVSAGSLRENVQMTIRYSKSTANCAIPVVHSDLIRRRNSLNVGLAGGPWPLIGDLGGGATANH